MVVQFSVFRELLLEYKALRPMTDLNSVIGAMWMRGSTGASPSSRTLVAGYALLSIHLMILYLEILISPSSRARTSPCCRRFHPANRAPPFAERRRQPSKFLWHDSTRLFSHEHCMHSHNSSLISSSSSKDILGPR